MSARLKKRIKQLEASQESEIAMRNLFFENSRNRGITLSILIEKLSGTSAFQDVLEEICVELNELRQKKVDVVA